MRSMILALAALSFCAAQDQELPLKLSGNHYDIQTDGNKEQAKELLNFMELVHATYLAILKPKEGTTVWRSTIILYKDQDAYAASGAPAGSGAYYDPMTRNLVGWYDTVFMRPFFAHEGMHQFTDCITKKDFPYWFNEGIADCIGNSEVRDGKLYMCIKGGQIARMRIPIIQEALKNDQHVPLSKLIALSSEEFMHPRTVSLNYAEAWSFCHFLIAYPKQEDRSHQIPNGQYRKNLAFYYESYRAGNVSHEEAWAKAFKDIPIEKIEEQWKKYVLEMDPGRFLGFNGKELDDEEAKALKLPKGNAAIRIDAVAPDGHADKAGLKTGDIMLNFDGKPFPRHNAIDRLRSWIQQPAGPTSKIKALRDGTEIEIVVKW